MGLGLTFSFTWAAILSRSFLPCGVSFLPPVAVSFSTSFIPSRDWRTLRAIDEFPRQKWLGAVPLLFLPTMYTRIFEFLQPSHTTFRISYSILGLVPRSHTDTSPYGEDRDHFNLMSKSKSFHLLKHFYTFIRKHYKVWH